MKLKRLPRKFYTRDTHVVAKELLGKLIVRKYRNKLFIARINEVESYIGEDDLASHASRGRTPRTDVMYGPAGHAYVYFIYGMYNMLNIVTDQTNFPAAVLIRGATWDEGAKINGPGKLTRAFHIDRTLNREDMTRSNRLYIADDGFRVPKKAILTAPRIGVDYAGEHALLPWRYFTQSE